MNNDEVCCPFCNNDILEWGQSKPTFHYVKCPRCGATSPYGLTREQAIVTWRKLGYIWKDCKVELPPLNKMVLCYYGDKNDGGYVVAKLRQIAASNDMMTQICWVDEDGFFIDVAFDKVTKWTELPTRPFE